MVDLIGLLRVQLVDLGIAAINVGATLDDKRGQSARGVAKRRARAAENSVAKGLPE
jgi:hypothetical protein